MMAADSLHARVYLIMPSGVRFCCSPPCYRACNASADSAHRALHFALFSNVQTACLKRARPAAIAAFVGVLPAYVPAPPPRRCRERKRPTKAEGKTKGGGTCPPVTPVCTWGSAAQRGFAAVLLRARMSRCYCHVRVLRTTGHAIVLRGHSHE